MYSYSVFYWCILLGCSVRVFYVLYSIMLQQVEDELFTSYLRLSEDPGHSASGWTHIPNWPKSLKTKSLKKIITKTHNKNNNKNNTQNICCIFNVVFEKKWNFYYFQKGKFFSQVPFLLFPLFHISFGTLFDTFMSQAKPGNNWFIIQEGNTKI